MAKTKVRPEYGFQNRVVKYNPNGDSEVDLSGLKDTDVVWVRTRLGCSRFMDGRFVRLDESRNWTYTAIEVVQANPVHNVYYTIDGVREWISGWGLEATWSDICPAAWQLWQLAEDSAKHYHHAHPGYKPVKVKLDINGADFGTYNVSVKLNPEYTVKEAR